MKKVHAVKVSLLFWSDEGKFSVERIFLLPKKYLSFSVEGLNIELRKLLNKENVYILAFKYGTVNINKPFILKELKAIEQVEMVDNSDWFIDPMFDDLRLETLDKRADPMILMIGDPKRIKHRISYYIDLINRGYSKEEALSYLY